MTKLKNAQTIGVIGGGQLAWMLAPAAKALGLQLMVQTPNETDPAVARADGTVLAPITDVEGTKQLAAQCDVITFENEFIDVPGLQHLAAQGTQFRPALDVLALVLDKLHQRQFFDRIGLPNPRYTSLEGDEDTATLVAQAYPLGFPLVLKTRRLGYDGGGTFVVADAAQLQLTWDKTGHVPILLEEFVPFQKELAVMVARSPRGDIAVYPAVETQQVDQICRRVIAPARVNPEVATTLEHLARTLATQLQLVGIVGIECFLTQDNRVLINEIAPRTHNSGHYTIDACETSQFEQQLRAVSDHPLGSVALTCPQALMVNLLGLEQSASEHQRRLSQLRHLPDATVYWYGKAVRPGRKLGHITLRLGPTDDPMQTVNIVEHLWYGSLPDMPYPLSTLNAMSQADFIQALGPTFENTPAIAASVWQQRPFASIDELHRHMVAIVRAMSPQEKLALLQAHPDLGGRIAMAEASVAEQSSAGLDQLSPEAYDRFQALNQQYRQTFGFPFILAVAGHTKASILKNFAERVDNPPHIEMVRALSEIERIAHLRLKSWIEEG